MTIQWTSSEIEIFEQFHWKCVRCQRKAVTLHEIVPRSKTKHWDTPENRVPICNSCHLWAHHQGARNSADQLRELRKQRLEQYDIPG